MGKRAKIYQFTSDASDTTDTVMPGAGYTIGPIGNYSHYTESSGTYTITFVAGTSASVSNLMFLEG